MTNLAQWMRTRDRVLIMGILNITPDSFFDGGRYNTFDRAVERGLRLVDEGADILDIGGESTRPGSQPVATQQELDRVVPVIEALHARTDAILSIDTTKALVAREAIAAGATVVNDISALRCDPEMADIVAGSGAFVVLMHMLGTPGTMQVDPVYSDVVQEILGFLEVRLRATMDAGIPRDRILLDPGIGFGKRLEHNLDILRNIWRFAELGPPILIGLSRKSFLGAILDASEDERLSGTIAANAAAVLNGADALRVHDVKEGRQAADVAIRLRR